MCLNLSQIKCYLWWDFEKLFWKQIHKQNETVLDLYIFMFAAPAFLGKLVFDSYEQDKPKRSRGYPNPVMCFKLLRQF